MALVKPRMGIVLEDRFATQPEVADMGTLGDPEAVVWSSIMQLMAADVADSVLATQHGVRPKRQRTHIARNIGVYLEQAFEFHCAAQGCDARTAPLLHYYSVLHLAKALVEIKCPSLHTRRENYGHGVSWRPNRNYVIDPAAEYVKVLRRRNGGVWHLLWEGMADKRLVTKDALRFRIPNLFALCPEISVEFERTFSLESQLVRLIEPAIRIDKNEMIAWITFKLLRGDLESLGITRRAFMRLISHYGTAYRQVRSEHDNELSFELIRPRRYHKVDEAFAVLSKEMRAINPFASLEHGKMKFLVPLQRSLPRSLPQLMVLYTLMYWLGSVVRYDPHSIKDLQNSRYWVLVDGFMNQSRIWLVELFEMHLYRIETHLASAR